MESSVSTGDALVRPWRMATIVASAIAAVELIVLLAIGAVFLGPPLLDWARSQEVSAAPTATKAKAKEAPANAKPAREPQATQQPLLPRRQTSVLVLNGNGVSGAAAAEAEVVRAKRYVIAAVGNAPRSDYRRTIIMYRPGRRGEAVRLSHDLGLGTVTPLDGLRRSRLMGAHVAVVIGAA